MVTSNIFYSDLLRKERTIVILKLDISAFMWKYFSVMPTVSRNSMFIQNGKRSKLAHTVEVIANGTTSILYNFVIFMNVLKG